MLKLYDKLSKAVTVMLQQIMLHYLETNEKKIGNLCKNIEITKKDPNGNYRNEK
jgi:hypothetical protein